jgi:hypothetical protein
VSTIDLNELERVALAAADASPGKWRSADCISPRLVLYHEPSETYIASAYCDGAGKARVNMRHIAAFSPPTVLTLIAQAREAERLREALRTTLGLIAANRLMLGQYSGVREVGRIEDRARAALGEEAGR